jgi:hypothetical protein
VAEHVLDRLQAGEVGASLDVGTEAPLGESGRRLDRRVRPDLTDVGLQRQHDPEGQEAPDHAPSRFNLHERPSVGFWP